MKRSKMLDLPTPLSPISKSLNWWSYCDSPPSMRPRLAFAARACFRALLFTSGWCLAPLALTRRPAVAL